MTSKILTEEQCAELERKARNCRDNARAELLVNDGFMEEYQRGRAPFNPDANPAVWKRSMEVYDFTIGGQRRAREYTSNAELYEAAAEMGRAAIAARASQ